MTNASVPLHIGVIIGTRNRVAALLTCVSSLVSQTRRPDEVIIIDDGAMDDTGIRRLFARHSIRYRYVKKEDHFGLVYSRNMGARLLTSDIALFLDDDVILDRGYIEAILRVYQQDTDGTVGGVGGVLVDRRASYAKRLFLWIFGLYRFHKDGLILPNGFGVLIRDIDQIERVDWLSGCNMSFRRAVVEEFRFDESLRDNGWGDDKDFSYRVARRYTLLATPHARVVHLEDKEGRVTKREFGFIEIYHQYVFFRNHMSKCPGTWLAFWWALTGLLLKNLLTARLNQAGGNLSAMAAIVKETIRKGDGTDVSCNTQAIL
ncbi:MAG: glycosyltransferase family 2 protein [Candidatus Omnitrophica bacterium]|nr:glycosyltransferase family 2 protein [Candidatus Omnitrophota bacterium]